MAGELKDPHREVPLALFIGLSIVCVLYILVSIAYLTILTPEQVSGAERVASLTAHAVMGDLGAKFIALCVAISTFGCVNGMTISGPRVYYAMSRDGLLPGVLGDPHPNFQTPFLPVMLQGYWSIVLVWCGSYEKLYNYVMFVGWVFYMLAGIALILERKKNPGAKCYAAWGYPWTTYGFIAASAFLFVTTFYNYTMESLLGILILLVGAVLYLVGRLHTHY